MFQIPEEIFEKFGVINSAFELQSIRMEQINYIRVYFIHKKRYFLHNMTSTIDPSLLVTISSNVEVIMTSL